jgi:type 1 glutamine amidotransferase
MKRSIVLLSVLAAALIVPAAAQQQAPAQPAAVVPSGAPPAIPAELGPPVRVYLRAGLKTHAEGQHDYPQWLADWSKLLMSRNAIVDGSLHFPTKDELANVDVLVMYKGDAGYLTTEEKATLEAFLKRGGGLVGMHDAICAEDATFWSTVYGGAKKHGEVNYTLEAPVTYTITEPTHPIMQGMTGFTITDEAFFLMTWDKIPGFKPLATAPMASTPSAGTHAGEIVPQMWAYEKTMQGPGGGQPYRAFVWMQGHNYSNFTHPQIQPMLLRAVAWAAKRPADYLLNERPARGGGGGGRGGRGRGAGAGVGAPGARGGAPAPAAPAPAGRGN